MTLDDAKQCLVEAGYQIRKEERLGNKTGTLLRLDRGVVVNVYDNGNYSCEGRKVEVVEALLDRRGAASDPKPAS